MKLYLLNYYLALGMFGLGTVAWLKGSDYAIFFALAGAFNAGGYFVLKKKGL